LFLGQPVYTFAVVLASLLIFTGIGSYAANIFRARPVASVRWIIAAILVTLFLTAFFTPLIFSAALGLALEWRVLIAVLIVAPLGVLLGVPFPTGLRLLSEEEPVLIPWARGVKGFFTVIGSVGALMLGMAFGFKMVLTIAALWYLTAFTAITLRGGVLT